MVWSHRACQNSLGPNEEVVDFVPGSTMRATDFAKKTERRSILQRGQLISSAFFFFSFVLLCWEQSEK